MQRYPGVSLHCVGAGFQFRRRGVFVGAGVFPPFPWVPLGLRVRSWSWRGEVGYALRAGIGEIGGWRCSR